MSACTSGLVDAAAYARCLRYHRFTQRRCLSSQAPRAIPATGAARLPDRRLISLHGPDAPRFLQGILTNNVNVEGDQAGFFAAFLNAQGKVLNDVFVYPTAGTAWQKEQFGDEQPGYLVEVDADTCGLLFKHLKRHKLRSQFKLRVVEDGELHVWSVWKDERWTQHTRAKSGQLSLIDGRAPGMGQRILLNTTTSEELDGIEEAPLSAYTLRRYVRGVPEGQREISREDSLPMNYNLDIMGGIDFKKGCYIGQELTIRTHHTGVVRRRVLPVQLYTADAEPPADLQYDPAVELHAQPDIKRDDAKRRTTGKLLGSVGNLGLALCRLEQMSDVNVTSEASSFSPQDRFLLEAGANQTLGVKAFVPDWMRSRIRDPKAESTHSEDNDGHDIFGHPHILTQSYDSRLRLDQTRPHNGDGFGVGYYTCTSTTSRSDELDATSTPPARPAASIDLGPEPCIFTSTIPAWNCRNLERLASKTVSPLIFAHVRASTEGALADSNCHPFSRGALMWMHNGGIGGFKLGVKRRLVTDIGDRWFESVGGSTDSEWAFALFLDSLEQLGVDADDETKQRDGFGHTVLRRAMLKTIERINGYIASLSEDVRRQSDTRSLLNFAVTDGKSVICTRYVSSRTDEAASLFFSSGTSWTEQPGERSNRTGRPSIGKGEYKMERRDRGADIVLVASEPLTFERDNWVTVPTNSVVTIHNQNVLIHPILDEFYNHSSGVTRSTEFAADKGQTTGDIISPQSAVARERMQAESAALHVGIGLAAA